MPRRRRSPSRRSTSVDNSGLLQAILRGSRRPPTSRSRSWRRAPARRSGRYGAATPIWCWSTIPEAEARFIGEGTGSTTARSRGTTSSSAPRPIPPMSPAASALAALKAIAAARAAFVSRGDRGGTNAGAASGSRGYRPEDAGGGAWYKDIGGGMGQALNAAAAMPAYTLSDRGTWLSFKNKGPLTISIEGDPHLINRYDVIELNPQKHGDRKLAAAKIFADWLVSPSRPGGDRRQGRWRRTLQSLRRAPQIELPTTGRTPRHPTSPAFPSWRWAAQGAEGAAQALHSWALGGRHAGPVREVTIARIPRREERGRR